METKDMELRRDCILRLGFDLIEVILSYLSFEDKIKFESICKQLRHLLFNKQNVIQIHGLENKNVFNSLNQIISEIRVHGFNPKVININGLDSVLKKYKFINKIVLKRIRINDRVIETITKDCNHLTEIDFYYSDIDISEDLLMSFAEKFGLNLVKISVNNQRISNYLMKKFLNLCPKLKSIKIEDFETIFEQNEQFLPKLETILCVIPSDHSKLFSIIGNKYNNQLKKIRINIRINIRNTYVSSLNQLILKLKLLSINCINIEDLTLFLTFGVLTPELFESITCFPNLKKLWFHSYDSSQFLREKLFGEYKCCQKLITFRLSGYKLNEKHIEGIDIFAPNLKRLSYSSSELTDDSIYCLTKLSKLTHFIVGDHFKTTYDMITDSGVCHLLNCCQNLKYIYLNCIPKITDKTIDCIIKKAVNNPKMKFSFHSGVSHFNLNILSFNSINNQNLPKNLKLVFN